MIITAHQPNYLPGLNVIEKIEAADAVIWLEGVQYENGGWTNRNRMPDGSWLTVPVERSTLGGQISGVRISGHDDWGLRHYQTIKQNYGRSDVIDAVCTTILSRPRMLVDLNYAVLRVVLDDARWCYQTALDGVGATASERLASMVEGCGGTEYLSGPSGGRYLDEEPFRQRGIKVSYFAPPEDCSCVLSRYSTR